MRRQNLTAIKKDLENLKAKISLLQTKNNNLSFLESVERFGKNDRGEKLVLNQWHKEYYSLLGNLDIAVVYATGVSQIGKTIANTLLNCWLISNGYNTIWAYDQERNLNRCVPLQFRPVINSWLDAQGFKLPKNHSQSNNLFQAKGSAIFTYTSTTKQNSNNGKAAAAGSSVVSVTADLLFIEERSQHLPGSDAPLYRRLDAGKIATHPVRQLGTPGNGNGIESEIDKAHHYFYPACVCPSCQETIFLDPKGCLLKPEIITSEKGDRLVKYLSENGKPQHWYCHDVNNPIETAYFACPECKKEIPSKNRLYDSFFLCKYSQITLKDFLASNPDPSNNWKIGINLSPLLRESVFNLAGDIISSGLNTSNTADWQQQRLGHPSESSSSNVTLEILKHCIHANSDFERKPDFILCGIDQGRSYHWLVITEYYLPKPTYENRLTKYDVYDKSIRNIVFAGGVSTYEIPNKLKSFNVSFGIIDNEPDIANASRLANFTCLQLADQKSNALKDIEKGISRDGGIEYPCWKIHNERFLRQVLNNFVTKIDGEPLTRLPDKFAKWLNNNSDISPLRHYMSPRYNPDSEKWERTDHVDDIYYATMFCEVAFAITVNKPSTMWGNL